MQKHIYSHFYGREQASLYLSNTSRHSPSWRHFQKPKLVNNKPLRTKTRDEVNNDITTGFYGLWLKLLNSNALKNVKGQQKEQNLTLTRKVNIIGSLDFLFFWHIDKAINQYWEHFPQINQ